MYDSLNIYLTGTAKPPPGRIDHYYFQDDYFKYCGEDQRVEPCQAYDLILAHTLNYKLSHEIFEDLP